MRLFATVVTLVVFTSAWAAPDDSRRFREAYERGQHYAAKRMYEEAASAFKAAHELRPNDAVVLGELGWSQFQTGQVWLNGRRIDPAQLIRRSISLTTEPAALGRLYYSLGRILERDHDRSAALAAYTKSLVSRPGNAPTRQRLNALQARLAALPEERLSRLCAQAIKKTMTTFMLEADDQTTALSCREGKSLAVTRAKTARGLIGAVLLKISSADGHLDSRFLAINTTTAGWQLVTSAIVYRSPDALGVHEGGHQTLHAFRLTRLGDRAVVLLETSETLYHREPATNTEDGIEDRHLLVCADTACFSIQLASSARFSASDPALPVPAGAKAALSSLSEVGTTLKWRLGYRIVHGRLIISSDSAGLPAAMKRWLGTHTFSSALQLSTSRIALK